MQQVVYQDKLIRLLGIPSIAFAIEHISNDNSISDLLRMPSYYSDIVFALLLTFIAWQIIKKIIIFLDKKSPWSNGIFNRFVLSDALKRLSTTLVNFYVGKLLCRQSSHSRIIKLDCSSSLENTERCLLGYSQIKPSQ